MQNMSIFRKMTAFCAPIFRKMTAFCATFARKMTAFPLRKPQ